MKLQEATKLPDALYKDLDAAIARSRFWEEDNLDGDADMNSVAGEWHSQSPAAEVLGWTIENHLAAEGIPISIVVMSADAAANKKLDLPVYPGHKLYPNRLVVGGAQGVSESTKHPGRFVMYLNMVPVDEDFNPDDVNPSSIAQIVANIVRHELIHSQHFEKRRRKQGTSRLKAKERFEAEGEIVDSDNRPKYLGSKIEIDAHAHEFAEELLQRFGKVKALEILRGKLVVSDSKLPDTFVEYMKEVPGRASTIRLKKKMYSHIMDMTERGLYERIVKKLLLLNESFTSHSFEPTIGDEVVNTNPGCKHFGSEGIVVNVADLPEDRGKVISYQCTNDGDNFDIGDVLEKTMDQLAPKV